MLITTRKGLNSSATKVTTQVSILIRLVNDSFIKDVFVDYDLHLTTESIAA